MIRELSMDMDKIVKAEGAGLLSDALVDKAFADMCSRLGVARQSDDIHGGEGYPALREKTP